MDVLLHEFWGALAPFLLEAILGVAMLLLTWIGSEIHRKWGWEIQLGARDMLEQALRRILVGAFDRNLSRDAIIDIALAYLKSTIPGALRRLGVTDAALRERIAAELLSLEARR